MTPTVIVFLAVAAVILGTLAGMRLLQWFDEEDE